MVSEWNFDKCMNKMSIFISLQYLKYHGVLWKKSELSMAI